MPQLRELACSTAVDQSAGAPCGRPTRDLCLLLLACLALWATTMGLWDLWGPDETRYVQVARELLERPLRNWLLLTVNYEPYDQKPPLPFWAFAAMLKLSGGVVSTWTVRLPSVLMGTLAVLLTYLIGRRRFNRRVGWLAAWLLLTAPLFAVETPSARLDIIFTGCVALAMWAWLARRPGEELTKGRVAVYWLGFIGAFFVKGPPVLLIVLLPLAWETWRMRSWRPLRELHFISGILLTAALVGGWLYVQHRTAPPGFVEAQLESATLERLFNPELHSRPVWYYLVNLFIDGFPPWSFFLAAGVIVLWRRRRARMPQWPALRPVLVWALLLFVIFSLIPGKREQYLLPIYPAMALVAAWFIETHLLGRNMPRRLRIILAALAFLLGLGVLGLAGYFIARPDSARQLEMELRPHHLAIWIAFGLFLAATTWFWLKLTSWDAALRLTIRCMVLAMLGLFVAVNPIFSRADSTRSVSEAANRFLAPGPPVIGALGSTMKPEFQVYGQYRMIDLDSDPRKLSRRADTLPRVIIARPDDWAEASPALVPLGYTLVFQTGAHLDHVGVFVRPEPGERLPALPTPAHATAAEE